MATAPPLTREDFKRKVKARPPRSNKLPATSQRIFVAGGDEAPKIKTRVARIEGRPNHYEVLVEIDGVRVEQRAFPSPIKGKAFRRGMPRSSEAVRKKLLSPFIPDHLSLAPAPKEWVQPTRVVFEPGGPDTRRPTTIFPPDNRQLFQDASYPWGTIGVVETPHASGSGVMIGPRHLLTVSHVIDWNVPPPFAANWVKFTPSYFDGSEPFGHAFSTNIYWFNKDNGDNAIDSNEALFDYVVVVLDSRIGETTGWMGSRSYTDAWDPLAVWSHMGYPGDLNGGQRPCFQDGFTLDGTNADAQAILHQADVFPGQSGGPMFAWWDGEVGPSAVAVQSWQNTGSNGASGGEDLVELVVAARNDFA